MAIEQVGVQFRQCLYGTVTGTQPYLTSGAIFHTRYLDLVAQPTSRKEQREKDRWGVGKGKRQRGKQDIRKVIREENNRRKAWASGKRRHLDRRLHRLLAGGLPHMRVSRALDGGTCGEGRGARKKTSGRTGSGAGRGIPEPTLSIHNHEGKHHIMYQHYYSLGITTRAVVKKVMYHAPAPEQCSIPFRQVPSRKPYRTMVSIVRLHESELPEGWTLAKCIACYPL